MKIKLLLALLVIIGLGAVVWWKQSNKILSPNSNTGTETSQTENSQEKDMDAIKSFMAEPNLDLIPMGTGLPQPYFMVGKVSQLEKGDGIQIDKVPEWVRQVNIYEQKDLINRQCEVYEYQTDARNNTLTAVHIRNLRSSEVDVLKSSDITCGAASTVPKLSKAEAETVATDYLKRALPNFDQIRDQLTYSQKLGGESQEWRWEDKRYKLPEGLGGDPYSYPVVRIVIYGDKSILYENTMSLFEN
ncbi:MAG: hypothetical protein ABIJ05_02840 [Patescibacteria group bacterium]